MKIDRKKMSLRLNDLVDSMCEVTGLYDKRSLNKYTSIASEWIEEMPAFIAEEMARSQLSDLGYDIPISKIRDKFSYRYKLNGKAEYWLYKFQEIAPLYKITLLGWRTPDGRRQYSKGWPIYELESEQMTNRKHFAIETPNEYDVYGVSRIDILSLEAFAKDSYERSQDTSKGNVYIERVSRGYTAAMGLLNTVNIAGERIDNRYYNLEQYYTRHQWGRLYNTKNSYGLQTLPSACRNAALSGLVNLDLETAVFAYYKKLATMLDVSVPDSLDEMLESKTRWRKGVAKSLTHSNIDDEYKIQLVKQATTALGFGAQKGSHGSIAKIIYHARDRDAFEQHPWILELIQLKRDLVNALKLAPGFKQDCKENPSLLHKNNSVNWNKVMAYMYQIEESKIVSTIKTVCNEHDVHIHLYLHDGIYVDAKYISLGLAPIVEKQLQTTFGATYKLKAEKLNPWTHYNSTGAAEEAEKIISHQQNLANEEARAREWSKRNQLQTPAMNTEIAAQNTALQDKINAYKSN
jgi:hypothetical protein